MKIKRFVVADMRQAIREVRDALGPDAVILSNQRLTTGGIEIVAAIDYDEALVHQAFGVGMTGAATEAKVTEIAGPPRPAPELPKKAASKTIAWEQEPALAGMKSEISTLRHMLETQLSSLAWSDMMRRRPMRAALMRDLMGMGFGKDLATELVDACPDDLPFDRVRYQALARLAKRLPTAELPIEDTQGALALVGPTGVGKTTTIAKIAARIAKAHGPDQVALITVDTFRIGAQDQLSTYAHLLGVPMFVAEDADELQALLKRLSNRRCVLIDTAGMSQRDVRLGEQLAALSQGGTGVRVVLVLSAAQQTASTDEAVRAFSRIPLYGCVLTKLDEVVRLGGALTVAVKHDLPIVAISDGQRVPEDLHQARGHQLVSRAVGLAKQSGAEKDRTLVGEVAHSGI